MGDHGRLCSPPRACGGQGSPLLRATREREQILVTSHINDKYSWNKATDLVENNGSRRDERGNKATVCRKIEGQINRRWGWVSSHTDAWEQASGGGRTSPIIPLKLRVVTAEHIERQGGSRLSFPRSQQCRMLF